MDGIFSAKRAILALERAWSIHGVTPTQLIAVLWPLWQVEITATVEESQSYDVIDTFVARAVAAGIVEECDIADFLGLRVSVVAGCLRFLENLRHIVLRDGRASLTELGTRSVRHERRFVVKEARQQLLFDQCSSEPLPLEYYDRPVKILTEPKLELSDGTMFSALYAPSIFQPGIIDKLAQRRDRAEYNLPERLTTPTFVAQKHAWLPAYLVATTSGRLLACSVMGQDPLLERLCNENESVRRTVGADAKADERSLWSGWLSTLGARLVETGGRWRAVMPASAFGEEPAKLKLRQLALPMIRKKRWFLQVWCEDQGLRRAAYLDRAVEMRPCVDNLAALEREAATLAPLYEVPPATIDELLAHAKGGLDDLQ